MGETRKITRISGTHSALLTSLNNNQVAIESDTNKFAWKDNSGNYHVAMEGLASSIPTGAVTFGDSGNFAWDENNLFWDNTNKYLGINRANPSYPLDLLGQQRIKHNSSDTDPIAGSQIAQLTVENTDATADNYSMLMFVGGDDGESARNGTCLVNHHVLHGTNALDSAFGIYTRKQSTTGYHLGFYQTEDGDIYVSTGNLSFRNTTANVLHAESNGSTSTKLTIDVEGDLYLVTANAPEPGSFGNVYIGSPDSEMQTGNVFIYVDKDVTITSIGGIFETTGFEENILGNTAGSKTHIKFPSTPTVSTDANTLDAYAEGEITVGLSPNSGSITLKTDTRTLKYVRIGGLVTVSGKIKVDSVSSPTGVLSLTGLPYTVPNSDKNRAPGVLYIDGADYTLVGIPAIRAGANTTQAYLYAYSIASGLLPIDIGDYIIANTELYIYLTYQIW